jgi:hypothetical protein
LDAIAAVVVRFRSLRFDKHGVDVIRLQLPRAKLADDVGMERRKILQYTRIEYLPNIVIDINVVVVEVLLGINEDGKIIVMSVTPTEPAKLHLAGHRLDPSQIIMYSELRTLL